MIAAELHDACDPAHFNADLTPWGIAAWHPNPVNEPALVFAARTDSAAK